MLRKIRIVIAVIMIVLLTTLFLDYTGTLHVWFGWVAKTQLVPAILAGNIIPIILIVLVTLLLGRAYCSMICPLGIFQDIVSWVSSRRKGKKTRFRYSQALSILRYVVLALFVIAFIVGIGSLVALIEPYSMYGRMVQNLLAPLFGWGNNFVAYLCERVDSYAVYTTDVWIRSGIVFTIVIVTFIVLIILAWRNGRTYCNTFCPVGTFLGLLSRYAWLKIRIDTDKCNGCHSCEKHCKASCIDSAHHQIDYSRCVDCMDCIDACKQGAISFGRPKITLKESPNIPRRSFLVGTAMLATSAVLAQGQKKVDGGLAVIEDKIVPKRHTPLLPAGSLTAKHFASHCTGCQLCISECPNNVLHPSTDLLTLMQPIMDYDKGFCRPECTRCSELCPTGAIKPITRVEKSSIQIGHAVWIPKNCVPLNDDMECGNCARHCPTGAITMIRANDNQTALPSIDTEKCIGCGACEYVCPARPFSAIYVEGHEVHREI